MENVGIVYEYVATTENEKNAIADVSAIPIIRALGKANPHRVLFLPNNNPPMIVVHADLRNQAKTTLRGNGIQVTSQK